MSNNIYELFDDYGNLYLNYDNNIYQFDITSNNTLELFKVNKSSAFDYQILDNNLNNYELNNLLLSNNDTSLKSNVIKNYVNNINENNIDIEENKLTNDNTEIDFTIDELNNKIIYLNEDLDFDYEQYKFYDNDFHEDKFISFSNNQIPKLVEITQNNNYNEFTLNMSIYDTYLYNNNKLFFVNKLNNNTSSYRIIINNNNNKHLVKLKIIGGKMFNYNINIINNELQLTEI